MHHRLALVMLLLTPALASAQFETLIGKRVRAKLSGPEGPWAPGFVMETNSDSLTMQLSDKRTVIRLSTTDVTVQQSAGYNSTRGLLRGALIGSIAAVALVAPDTDGLDAVVGLVMLPIGAAVGGGIGFALASERWTPVSNGTLACGGWRTLDGRPRTSPIVVRGPRNRKRGALIGAAVLGGIGLVAGIADPELASGELPGVVLGNAAVGLVAGAFFGPREKVVIPASCP